MPLEECKLPNGKSGTRWGGSGKCYKDKKDAIRQGIAIEGPAKFEKIMKTHGDEDWDAVYKDYVKGTADKWSYFAEAYISQKERDKIPAEDFGDPADKKYPVRNQQDLDAAVKLVGRAPPEKQAAIKERLKKIAKRKGLKLPDSWE